VSAEEKAKSIGDVNRLLYISIYVSLAVGYSLFVCFRGLAFYRAVLLAATRIHAVVFNTVLKARMSFFDATPMGRLLNRFSNDMDQASRLFLLPLLQSNWH
jgi:ABC-type multidrug transport system fused ATPase/permease subunit